MSEDALPAPPAPPVESWRATEYPPRCPRCFYLLAGLPPGGTCPECGAAFDNESRLAYAYSGGFWRGFLRWTWPALAALAVCAVMAASGLFSPGLRELALSAGATTLSGLALVALVNATFHGYRTFRRHRLRHASVTAFVPTAGLFAQAFGCGIAVFALSLVFVFGVSCAMILTFGGY